MDCQDKEIEHIRHTIPLHDANFATALEPGKKPGITLPKEIVNFAVEVEDVITSAKNARPQWTKRYK